MKLGDRVFVAGTTGRYGKLTAIIRTLGAPYYNVLLDGSDVRTRGAGVSETDWNEWLESKQAEAMLAAETIVRTDDAWDDWVVTLARSYLDLRHELDSLKYHHRPTRSEPSLEGAAVNGLTPVGQEGPSE